MAEWTKIEPEGEGKERIPAWKPKKEGDIIEGVLMERKTGVGQHKSNLYTILCQDGEYVVWGSAVIDSRLKDIPDDGAEMIRIEYLGEKEGANGTYKNYEVFHKPAEA